jgi:tetratricopeptide (TPR) repeat protein
VLDERANVQGILWRKPRFLDEQPFLLRDRLKLSRPMKTSYELMKWHMLVLAVGFLPSATATAAELSSTFTTARILYEERRYSEARVIFRQLAESQPGSTEVNFYLGRLALWFDDDMEALSRLTAAARAAPNSARIQNALGDAFGLAAQKANLLTKLSWARKCLAAYEHAVALEPQKVEYRWSLVGYYCAAPAIAGGGRAKAFQQAEEIRRRDPMGGRIAFATLFLSAHQAAEAFAQFDNAPGDHSENFAVLYQIGRCAALSGEQLERGRTALERCLALTPPGGEGMPTHASAHYRLANILEKMGERSAAAEHYAAALRVQPDFRAEKEILKN